LLLAVSDIFQYVRAHSSERVFTLTASYLEIYRESLRCLFGGGVDLPIVDDLIEGGAKVVGVREEELRSPRDFIALLLRGEEQRQVAATHLNERSSRSHTIFRLRIQSRRRRPLRHSPQSDFESFSDDSDVENQRNDDLDERMATLNLVDLAGSESIAHLGDPIRRRECQFINKSLLTLERVILALATASHSRKHSLDHIPYRDSKLTRVLQSSLGGNSHVSVICTLAPSSVNRDESHKTLRFGSFARNVLVSAPRVNTSTDDQAQVMLRRYASTIADLRNQIRNLDAAIKDSQHDQETMRSLELENRAIALRLKEEQRSKQLLIARLNLAQTSTASLPMESAPSSDDDPTRSLRSLSLSPVQSSPRKPMSSHSNTFVSAQSDVELRSSNSSQSSVKSGSTARRPGMSASSLMMARARGNPSRPQPPVSTHSSKPTVLHVPKLNSVASTSNASRRRPIVSASTLETARTVVHGRSRASSSDYYLSGTSNHMSTESLSGPEIEVEASPVVFEAALSATADAPVRVPDSLIVPQLNKASASSAPALRIHSNDDEHVAAPSSLAIQVTAPSGVVTSNVVLGQSSSCLSLPLGWSEPKVVSYSASLFSPLHASHPSESQFEQTSAAKAIYCIADPLSSILADTQTLVTPVVTPAVNMHSEQLSETNSHASRPSSVASVSVVPSHQVFNDQSVLESELRQRLQAAEDNIRLLMQRFSTEVPAVTVQQNPVPSPLSESASSVAQATSALPQIDQSSDADSDELPELPELPDSSDGHEVRPKSEPELSSSAVNQSVQSASEAQSLLNQSLQEEISVAKAELEAARAAVSRANEEEARTKQAMLDLQTAVAAEKDRADNERRALKSQIDEETQLARRALLQVFSLNSHVDVVISG
jgi:centromeric protein E